MTPRWRGARPPTLLTGGQITVTKQSTWPGVGPTDDGKSLVDLANSPHAASRPPTSLGPSARCW